jgi:hypothetical protein
MPGATPHRKRQPRRPHEFHTAGRQPAAPGRGFLSDAAGSLAGMSGAEQAAGAGRVVAEYWAAVQARDWGAFSALLAEDVVYEVPQTRERVSGTS